MNESTGDFPISTNTTLCIETVQSFERILLPERLKKEKERERKKEWKGLHRSKREKEREKKDKNREEKRINKGK